MNEEIYATRLQTLAAREGHVGRLPVWPPAMPGAAMEARRNGAWQNTMGYMRRNPGLTRNEVAEALGISPNTVNNHLASARRRGIAWRSESVLIGCQKHKRYWVFE